MLAQEAMVCALLLRKSDFEESRNLAEHAIDLAGKEAQSYRATWAMHCVESGDFATAIPHLQAWVKEGEQAPDWLAAISLLSACHEELGQTAEALEVIDRALQQKTIQETVDEDTFRLRLERADLLARSERWDKAAQAYEQLTQMGDEKVGWIRRSVRLSALQRLAIWHDNEGRSAESELLLLQYLDEMPDDASGCNQLAYLWAEQGRHLELAESLVQTALAQEPDNAAYVDTLGWIYFKQGRFRNAITELERATTLEWGDDAVIWEHVGDAYRAAGEPDRARKAYRRSEASAEESGEQDVIERVQEKRSKLSPAVPHSVGEGTNGR